jgi:hypothetical protein
MMVADERLVAYGHPSENIGHFATQSEARNWKALQSTSYFVLREIEAMIQAPPSDDRLAPPNASR